MFLALHLTPDARKDFLRYLHHSKAEYRKQMKRVGIDPKRYPDLFLSVDIQRPECYILRERIRLNRGKMDRELLKLWQKDYSNFLKNKDVPDGTFRL